MDESILDDIPNKIGVYLMKDSSGKILYIGKSNSLKKRITQYFQGKDEREKIPYLMNHTKEIETIVTFTEREALLLEKHLIGEHRPRYNALLRDGNRFIYIGISRGDWPKLELIKEATSLEKFGPFVNISNAKIIINLLSKIFPLRECSDMEFKRRKHPCILHSMKRCVAPCVGLSTKEEYHSIVKDLRDLLKGKNTQAMDKIRKVPLRKRQEEILSDMLHLQEELVEIEEKDCDIFNSSQKGNLGVIVKIAFRNHRLQYLESIDYHTYQPLDKIFSSLLLQHYEREPVPKVIIVPEGLWQDKPSLLPKVIYATKAHHKKLTSLALENAKVLLNSLKDKEKILKEMKEKFSLQKIPNIIEVYDISKSHTTSAVASKVTFVGGVMDHKSSKSYNIQASDDYSAMKEVLQRRLTRGIDEENLPDLIVIDGGKGHLTTALSIIESLNLISIDVISISKERSLHNKGMTRETIFLNDSHVDLPLKGALTLFMQNIRDKAHARALSHHKRKVRKSITKSILDNIPGIGEKKKRALLSHFKSIDRIKKCDLKELLSIKGIREKDAKTILNWKW